MSHVQQRSDSADYVDKIEANVMDGFVSQFAPNPNMCLECTYLPCSVMHYGAYAFSVSKGTSPTLQPRDPLNLITMGIQKGLTAYDICTINREYGLTDARTCDSPSGCKFGTDFDGEFACDCMCASGLTGSDCGTFQSGTTGIALDSGETHTLSTDGLTYEENQQLNYMVYSTDESLHIKYTFREMVIEDDADCYWDQFNYWANTSVLYCPYTICGDHSGFSGVTSSNFFYAFFHSDDFWNERGFVIDFEVVA
ncbi:blastula protease 10-like [Diadema antillarum]|uniref:blastula protease 10-like n=1 Tax=Diadema antillarum TaxID=105358 RepID=UPI003A849DDC